MNNSDKDTNDDLSGAIREMANGLSKAGLMPDSTAREIEELLGEPTERIVLSERDFAHFVASLENPEPPTETLKAARLHLKELRRQHPESGW